MMVKIRFFVTRGYQCLESLFRSSNSSSVVVVVVVALAVVG